MENRPASDIHHGSHFLGTKPASGTLLQPDDQHWQVHALELQHCGDPLSIYVNLRKSLAKNASTAVKNVKSESSDDKVKILQKINQSLNANLEEAILEAEENSKTIYELNEKADILLEKLELSEQISEKKNAMDVVKDS